MGGWSTPRPGRFTLGNYPVPIILEAKWALGSVWTGAEILASAGIRSTDRPALSKSLYRLSCRGPLRLCDRLFLFSIKTETFPCVPTRVWHEHKVQKYIVTIKEIDTFNVMQYQNRQRSGHTIYVVAQRTEFSFLHFR